MTAISGNSQTGIGYSKDNTVAVTASGSFGFDIMAGFEYVAPLIETGGGVEFNTSHTFTVGATKSTSKEITVEYSNDTNDNMVLMYATPMTYYEYQVKYPDGTKKGNSPKLTSSMTLAVPGNPSMNMVSVDTYNKAASAYEGMQQIGSNLHLARPVSRILIVPVCRAVPIRSNPVKLVITKIRVHSCRVLRLQPAAA